jgi:hypothetical protein
VAVTDKNGDTARPDEVFYIKQDLRPGPPRSASINATTNVGSSSGTASVATNAAAPAAIPSQPQAARQGDGSDGDCGARGGG